MKNQKHIKPRQLTEEENKSNDLLDKISNLSDRSQRTAWKRKQKNIEDHISEVQELEDKIQTLQAKKQPILDQIAELRSEMVDSCIHPREYLVQHNDLIKCKFCEKIIRMINQDDKTA